MAQVILFGPQVGSAITKRPPLNLVCLGTPLVKRDFSVKIIDEESHPGWRDQLDSVLDDSTICVGVTVMTGGPIKSALEFSRAVKQASDVPVIWGGIHPSFLPEQTLENENVDIVVIGEGEQRLVDLVEHLKDGRPLDDIKGIGFKRDGEITLTEPQTEFLDMDTLPDPDYDLIDIEFYINNKREFMYKKSRVMDLNVDRGCPHRCRFCYNLRFNRRGWRGMSSAKVLDIVEKIVDKYNADAINFVSDNLFVKKSRVREICEGIIERGIDIEWHSDMRLDTFNRYDDELLGLVKKSGCSALTFGVESGSSRILEMINKDVTVEQVLKAHAKAKRLGFEVKYHFMMGFPEETRADLVDTMKLLRLLTSDKNTVIFGPSIYVPYPGTPLFDKCLEMGLKQPGSLEEWTSYHFNNDTRLPWLDKSYRTYLREAQTISAHASYMNAMDRSVTNVIYKNYCRARLVGMIHGISLHDMDNRVIRRLRPSLAT